MSSAAPHATQASSPSLSRSQSHQHQGQRFHQGRDRRDRFWGFESEAKHVQKDRAEGEGGEKNAGKDGGTTSKGDEKAEESKDSGEQKNKDAEGGGVSRAPKVPSLVLKETVVGIKFNNNEFNTWSGFDEALDAAMPDSKNLQFLDCSFNKFQTLGSVLGEYPELRVLYLHGNKIGRLKDIDRLKGLKSIRKLTLHGNPVEDKKRNIHGREAIRPFPTVTCA